MATLTNYKCFTTKNLFKKSNYSQNIWSTKTSWESRFNWNVYWLHV